MSSSNKTRLIAYLSGIFLAGALCGTFWGPRLKDWVSRTAEEPKSLAEHIEERLRQRLSLTETQLVRLRPLIQRNAEAIETLHCEAMQKIEDLLERTRPQVLQELTPAQIERFEQLEAERKAFFKQKVPPPRATNAPPAASPTPPR